MATATFKHGLYYPDNEGITLGDVAATLLAHEKLLPILREILERSNSGVTVEKIGITLDKIYISSLQEDFFVAIIATFQSDLEKEVPALISAITGVQIPERFDALITILFVLIIFYGAKKLLERRKSGTAAQASPPSITGDYNTYINIAAEHLHLSPEAMSGVVEGAIGKKNRRTVVRAAIDLFRPAKRGGNGRILPLGAPEVTTESVAEFPSEVALADLAEDTDVEHFDDAQLEIRAVDRDKADHGWAGKLTAEGTKTKRIRVKLYPTVDRSHLASLEVAHVEAIIESRTDEAGKRTPICIHVLNILS